MKLSLFYLSGNTTGGWVTYTAHLLYGLQRLTDITAQLYKVGNNTEQKQRSFGYGVTYRNVSVSDLEELTTKSTVLITAVQKNYKEVATQLMECGAWMVVHDPAEFGNLSAIKSTNKLITIRKTVQRQLDGSKLLPHPYLRHFPQGTVSSAEQRACSICRIDFDKHTDLLLQANRLLEDKLKIKIHGFENRLYTKFKIIPNYPEWEQSKCHYPREKSLAAEICNKSMFSVDMSIIKGDGGGTQYSFLEAMDGGSVNVIHNDWVLPNDEMIPGENCIAVKDADQLAKVIKSGMSRQERERIIKRTDALLQRHSPAVIARNLTKLLESH